jgi:hypothetical protein
MHSQPLVLHRTSIGKWAGKKFGINCQWLSKLFLIFIFDFSFVKAAMNAPRLCKLRKDFLTALGYVTNTQIIFTSDI